MENVLAVLFKNESEGFQAITELKKQPVIDTATIFQIALIKRDDKGIEICDRFDSEIISSSETVLGGLMGAFLGILGGPIGVLLMGSYGALIGKMVDVGDMIGGEALIETVADKLAEGEVALIALVQEETETELNAKFQKYDCEVARFDAAVVAEEVEEAIELQLDMARQAKYELRKVRLDDHKEKVEERRSKFIEELAEYKVENPSIK